MDATATALPAVAEPPASGAGARRDGMLGGALPAVSALSFAVAMRMLGLFLLLPVLAPHVVGLPGGSLELAGLAVGAYGLTQAIMLAPLGWLSDRVGRKPVLVCGLLVYALGGLLAAGVEHPVTIIVGRAVQGLGAITAVAVAAVADVTRPESRTKAMGVIGLGIGFAFGISMVAAVPLAGLVGVRGIFVSTSALAVLAAFCVLAVPLGKPSAAGSAGEAFLDARLLPLCLAVFALHFLMAAMFVFLPLELVEQGEEGRAWLVYLSAFLVSVCVAVPLIAKQAPSLKRLGAASACVALAAVAVPAAPEHGIYAAIAALALFFSGFNLLEAALPANVSVVAGRTGQGSAMGVYSIAQALGVFAGGAAAGTAGSGYNFHIMAAGAVIALAWMPLMSHINKRHS